MPLNAQDPQDMIPIIPIETLRHIYARFILNLPCKLKEECSQNFVRLFFEIERAHWFYLDYCIDDPSVGGVDMLGFTRQLFDAFPELAKGVNWQEKFLEWHRYRGATETGSAIIIDEYNKMILLVQGFYNNRWSFPGGKVNESESLVECAVREVLEETGLDIEHRISPDLFIDRHVGGTLRRAFIVENMPRTSRLQPVTKNEIEAITWFNVHDLPTHAQDNISVEKLNTPRNSFYVVMPFIKQLQAYIILRNSGLASPAALRQSQCMLNLQIGLGIPSTMVESVAKGKRNQARCSTLPVQQQTPNTCRVSRSIRSFPGNCLKSAAGTFGRTEDNLQLNFITLRESTTASSPPVFDQQMRLASCWMGIHLQKDALLDTLCPK